MIVIDRAENRLCRPVQLRRCFLLRARPQSSGHGADGSVDDDPPLTSPGAAVRKAYEPATYAHRLAYVTFYRTITTDALQGPSDAAVLKSALRARTYFLVDDRSTYGTGVGGAMAAYAARIGLRLVGNQHLDRSAPPSVASSIADSIIAKQPDGVYFARTYFYGSRFLKDLRQKGYTGPLVGPDGICDPAYTAAVNTYCTGVGLDPSAAARWFRIAYERRFHVRQAYFEASPVAQSYYDAPAYDAANIVLNAIYQAATHGKLRGSLVKMRTAILPYVAHVRWHGATGLTSFDRNGDTTSRIVSVYRAHKRKWAYWGVAPRVRGVNPTSG